MMQQTEEAKKFWQREFKHKDRNMNHKMESFSEGLQSRDLVKVEGTYVHMERPNFWCYGNILHY